MLQETFGKLFVETFVLVIRFDFDRGDVFQAMFSKVLREFVEKFFVKTSVLIFEDLRIALKVVADNNLDDVLRVARAEKGATEPRFPPRPLR